MAKRHWYTGLSGACKVPRSLLGWWYEISPSAFLDHYAVAPDRICTDCAKAARLALAAESAPKPDTVIWPKPRPISEAPTDGCILGWVPATDECRAGWELLHYSVSATEWRDNAGIAHEPTHFLPLPPEVR
jgi:hypothetical protein